MTSADPQLEQRLTDHVRALADHIGPRGLFAPEALSAAADLIEGCFESMGYSVWREPVDAPGGLSHNIVAERPGTEPDPGVWLVGAHYDTVEGTPGADDNASAVAVLLEMAREFTRVDPKQTVRFVAFTNEEMPHFSTQSQGAMVHAAGCRERGEQVHLMASLEMLGYYTDAPGSQAYPAGLSACYPDTGNFVAVIGSMRHGIKLKRLVGAFRKVSGFPCEYLATPFWMPALVRSDHFAFWLHRYPAVMITDTADFRNPHYHSGLDTPDTLDFAAMAQVSHGFAKAFARLAG
ncbi:MAG: M20/M25/M40 family metallo-hydrolase [Leptospirillia bacterium]